MDPRSDDVTWGNKLYACDCSRILRLSSFGVAVLGLMQARYHDGEKRNADATIMLFSSRSQANGFVIIHSVLQTKGTSETNQLVVRSYTECLTGAPRTLVNQSKSRLSLCSTAHARILAKFLHVCVVRRFPSILPFFRLHSQ